MAIKNPKVSKYQYIDMKNDGIEGVPIESGTRDQVDSLRFVDLEHLPFQTKPHQGFRHIQMIVCGHLGSPQNPPHHKRAPVEIYSYLMTTALERICRLEFADQECLC